MLIWGHILQQTYIRQCSLKMEGYRSISQAREIEETFKKNGHKFTIN